MKIKRDEDGVAITTHIYDEDKHVYVYYPWSHWRKYADMERFEKVLRSYILLLFSEENAIKAIEAEIAKGERTPQEIWERWEDHNGDFNRVYNDPLWVLSEELNLIDNAAYWKCAREEGFYESALLAANNID